MVYVVRTFYCALTYVQATALVFLCVSVQNIPINRCFDKSTALVGDGVPEAGPMELQGLELTVWSSNNDFSMVGYIVDQIESLIDEWFPGV